MKNINIKAVTQLTGLNENTLRAWERRYQVLTPERDENGNRQYSKKDIEKLSLIAELIQKGHQIGHLAELSTVQLKKLVNDLKSHTPEHMFLKQQSLIPEITKSEANKYLNKIIQSLKKFDLVQIQNSLQQARFELSPKTIITSLILPLMAEVGQLVADSKIKIAQEHLLSSLIRDHLGQIYQSLSPYDYSKSLKSKKIILTTREGDLHEFGILLAAILCRINGHQTYFLGPNMPVDDLAEACEEFKVDTLILGLASLPKETELISTNLFLKKLDQKISKKVELLCGGNSPIEMNLIKSDRLFMIFSTLDDLDHYLKSS